MKHNDKQGRKSELKYQVVDVTRTLHSASRICDQDHEILFTKYGAAVVPSGMLSRHLRENAVVAKYPRRGGLYVADLMASSPDKVAGNKEVDKQSGFTRQGADE